MHTAFLILQSIGILLTVLVIASLIHEEYSSGRSMILFILCLELLHGSGYLLELFATSQEAAMYAVRMQYLGGGFLVIFISKLIFAYCNAKEPKLLFGLLEIFALFFVVCVWTSNVNPIFYSSIDFKMYPTPHLVMGHGFGYYAFIVICMLFPYLLSEVKMVSMMKVESVKRRKSHYAMLIGFSVLPITSLFLYLTDFTGYFDPLPPIMSTMLPIIATFIWRKQTYDVTEKAAVTVIEELNDAVVLLDADKRVISFNMAAQHTFDDLTDASIGRSIVSVQKFPLELLAGEAEGGLKFAIGERAYIGSSKKIDDARHGNIGYVVIIYDATENRNNSERMMEMMQQAEENSAIMTEFLENMAYEIAKPIEKIAGLSDLIVEESRGRKVYQFACDIKSSAHELDEMLDDLSMLSKVEAGKLESVEKGYNLKALLSEISDSMSIVADKKELQFILEIDPALPCMLFGDEDAIKEILINLINNGIRQTKEGFIKISVTGMRKGDRIELQFVIEDTGIGLRQAEVRKVMEYYEGPSKVLSRDVARNQSGLSMSLSKRLLELVNGTLSLESSYGEGTSVTFVVRQKVMDWLSIGQYDQKPVEESAEEEMQMFLAPDCHILVVDDNLINRKITMGMLEGYKCHVDEAEGGQEAVEMAKHTVYDLIFMDQMMPGMDGVEATRLINQYAQQLTRRPKVVALTANAREGVKEMLLSSGFHDYLAKPVERTTMHHCLKKWISEDHKIYSGEMVKEMSAADVLLDDLDEIFMNGVNIAQAMKKHRGNLNDYLDILLLYYQDGLSKPREFDRYLEANDLENYGILCRAIRGASANIGAQNLADRLKDLELAAAAGEISELRELHEEMMDAYMAIMVEIREVLLRKHLLEEEDGEGKEIITNEELLRKLEHARQCLEELDFKECEQVMAQLKGYDINREIRDYLHDIRVKLRLSEVDEASKMIVEIILRLSEK